MRPALFAVSALLAAGVAQAEGFAVFNQSSFARAAALPALAGPPVLAAGKSSWQATLDWSSEYYEDANSRESLVLDAESQRLALGWRRGIGGSVVSVDGLEWSVELPLLFTGGGALDSLIEGWHGFFGLPNGGRENAPSDRHRIRYTRDGTTVVDLAEGDSGLGDLRLGLGAALGERLALRALLQLPTGEAETLRGGHLGGALWADYRLPLDALESSRLTLSAGVSASDTGGPLGDQQEPLAGLAGAALELPLFWELRGIAQFNFHSALYRDSGLAPLDGPSGQLAFGLQLPWAGGALRLGVQEDVFVHTAPDFSLHFGLRFGRQAGD